MVSLDDLLKPAAREPKLGRHNGKECISARQHAHPVTFRSQCLVARRLTCDAITRYEVSIDHCCDCCAAAQPQVYVTAAVEVQHHWTAAAMDGLPGARLRAVNEWCHYCEYRAKFKNPTATPGGE